MPKIITKLITIQITIGMDKRFAISKGETLPMPAQTTITAVIGDMVRAMELANCIGTKSKAPDTLEAAAMVGAKLANA